MNAISDFYENGWTDFDAEMGSSQELPPEKIPLIVRIQSRQKGLPDCMAIGYMSFAAGDSECPRFIVPGFPFVRDEETGRRILFKVLGWKATTT